MTEDVHPIRERAGDPLGERVLHLERALAVLWDEVWWLQLAPEERARYEAEGYRAPIRRFYRPLDEVIRGD